MLFYCTLIRWIFGIIGFVAPRFRSSSPSANVSLEKLLQWNFIWATPKTKCFRWCCKNACIFFLFACFVYSLITFFFRFERGTISLAMNCAEAFATHYILHSEKCLRNDSHCRKNSGFLFCHKRKNEKEEKDPFTPKCAAHRAFAGCHADSQRNHSHRDSSKYILCAQTIIITITIIHFSFRIQSGKKSGPISHCERFSIWSCSTVLAGQTRVVR